MAPGSFKLYRLGPRNGQQSGLGVYSPPTCCQAELERFARRGERAVSPVLSADMARLVLIGDCSPNVTAHLAIPAALRACQFDGRSKWLETTELARARLQDYAGIWVVPGSPYRQPRAVINAIRFAREHGVPFLGTCGGYQHAIMEVAEAVWGVGRAAHAEEEP